MFEKRTLGGKSSHANAFHQIPGYTPSRKKVGWNRKRIIVTLLIIALIGIGLGSAVFYFRIVRNLPDIADIEEVNFSQATTITDRNGEVLYTLFEENRQYVSYDDISEYFVNALVATEDQRYWTNPGVDRKGIARAGITDITQGKSHGGSTLTQQLIKNIMLTPEKRYERKFKEIVLAIKLNKYIKSDIRKKYDNLPEEEVERRMKEKILELYVNYIFLGNNSYGVETAAKTYFDKSASELSLLEGAILAGIPQAPSRYDPYNNRGSVMGKLVVTDKVGTPVEMTDGLFATIISNIQDSINDTNITFKKDDKAVIEYFKGLLSFQVVYENAAYQVSYQAGRKDSVLARMYEDGYITESQFKQSFLEGFQYEFKRGKVEINAPHFVFWVISLLEENYDPEMLRNGGLTITTSLDRTIQKMAEQSIEENEDHLRGYQVSNAAMIYTDSFNGDVLAYVGSKDYYNDDIDGQVDIIQSVRQPGSTIKPLVYALGFMRLPLTLDSPTYDIPFSVGNNTPENSDGLFEGLMTIRQALAHSRNIPAIKMFFNVGGEDVLKGYLQQLGLTSLQDDREYGYPLAIGAGEIPMIELTNAYMHLSAMGKPADINPILSIRASDGTLLYKKQPTTQEQIIPAGVSYLIWNILSNKANFPGGWVNTFSYPGINFATKSGTTNVKKGTEKLPRDGWMVAYTPTNVMMFWGGNTDGSALRKDAFGGWINSPIWKTFVKKLEENNMIQDQNLQGREVKSVSVSKVSGKLASFDTPLSFVAKTMGYINNIPTQVDSEVQKIQMDILCNGQVSELTPSSDIVDAYLINPLSPMPDKRDQQDIIDRWNEKGIDRYRGELGANVVVGSLTGTCAERSTIAELGEISLNIIQPADGQVVTRSFSLWHQTTSPFAIKNMKLYLDDLELKSFSYNKQGNLIDISTVTIPDQIDPGRYDLKVVVIDEKGYSDTKSIEINLQYNDTTPPYLMEDKMKITEKEDGSYDVLFLFADDSSTIATGAILSDGEVFHTFSSNVTIFQVGTLKELTYIVSDSAGNRKEANIDIAE